MRTQKLLFGIIITLMFFSFLTAKPIQLESVKLSGKDGGFATGEDWSSDSLLGKINVIIYIDPDKFSKVKQFISELEIAKSKNNIFDLTFIVNMEATILPTFIIKSKIKNKAKKSKTTSYVLDNDKIIIEKWNLKDNDFNILILDKLNKLVYQYSDKIKSNQIDEVMKIITKLTD